LRAELTPARRATSSMARLPGLSASRIASALPVSIGSLRCLQMSLSARLLENYATLREPPELGWRCGGCCQGARPPQLRRRFGASTPARAAAQLVSDRGEESLMQVLAWDDASVHPGCPRSRSAAGRRRSRTPATPGSKWATWRVPASEATAALGRPQQAPPVAATGPRPVGSTTRVGALPGSLAALMRRHFTREISRLDTPAAGARWPAARGRLKPRAAGPAAEADAAASFGERASFVRTATVTPALGRCRWLA
jgi:hypothetical protein